MTRMTRWAIGAVLALGIAELGCARADHGAPALALAQRAAVASEPAQGEQAVPAAGSLREIHVRLEVLLGKDTSARAAVGALGDLAESRGGYVASSSFGENESEIRTVLRAPPSAVGEVRRAAGALGTVGRDDETGTDVTDAITDLDARLRARKTEEGRLLALISERTGTIADVLAAERALADVRVRIERLDAEARAAHGRADLATIDVALFAPRGRASPRPSPALASAAKEGVHDAGVLWLALATGVLRAGPSAALVGALLAAAVALVRRWRARRAIAFSR